MSGIRRVRHLDEPYTCQVNTAVTGGQIVEFVPGSSRVVQVAAAGSVRVAGVAMFDVPTTQVDIQGPQAGQAGNNDLAVGRMGRYDGITFSSAAQAGDRLVVTANGQVAPAAATPDARTVIGVAPFDVAAAATGMVDLF